MNGETQMSKDNLSWITRRKLPKKIADSIEREAWNVPWYFFKDCAYGEVALELGLDLHPYFSHSLSQNERKSPYFNNFPFEFITDYAIMTGKRMIRSHITLHYPSPQEFGQHHNSHIDNSEIPHMVILYYVNDADGDTFFFKGENDNEIIHRETPERGKMVIFNGSQYHASSPPSKNFRMTLNINYELT